MRTELHYSLICIWIALTVLLAPHVPAGDLLLVSIHEYGFIEEQPCVVYRLNEGKTEIATYVEVPVEIGTRMTEVSPDGRYVVVWQYKDQFSKRNPVGTGQISIVDLSAPENIRKIPLPFQPVLGGYIRLGHAGNAEIVTLPVTKNSNPVVFSLAENRILSSVEIRGAWENVMYRGMLRKDEFLGSDPSSRALRFSVDPQSERLRSMPEGPRGKEYTSRLELSASAKNVVANAVTDNLTLECANAHVAIYRTEGVKADGIGQPQALIFNKTTEDWTAFSPSAPASDMLIYGDWIVERKNELEPRTNARPGGPTTRKVPNGSYSFYTKAGQPAFEWNTEPENILIGVLDSRLIYRAGESVHDVPFSPSGVAVEQDRQLIEDPKLERVYWAIPLSGAK